MGVLNTQNREKRNLFSNISSGDDTFPVDDDTGADVVLIPPIDQRSSRTSSKTSNAPRPQSHVKNTGRRTRGCKNSRKYENSVFLSNLIEPCEFDDLDITDFMVKSVSAFEMLFEDESRMNKWSEFMSMKEEEQEKYLKGLSGVSVGKCSSMSQSITGNTFNGSVVQNAAKCFQKIDKRIKTTLKSRKVSMAGLKYFEEEVLSFFIHVDEAVLVSLIPSSMDRLLIHGICQYMNLTSSSSPRHIIEVENKKDHFQPPVILLSQYLQRIR